MQRLTFLKVSLHQNGEQKHAVKEVKKKFFFKKPIEFSEHRGISGKKTLKIVVG